MTNRLALPFSAHFHREVSRRSKQIHSLINTGIEDTFRPHSLAPTTKTVSTNHSCILLEREKGIQLDAQWECASGMQCEKVVESNVGFSFGQCMPSKESLAGNTCRTGVIAGSKIRVLVCSIFILMQMCLRKNKNAT